jgi:hypothetical protein
MTGPGSKQTRPQIPIQELGMTSFDRLHRFAGIVGIGRLEECHPVKIARNAIIYRVEPTLGVVQG